VAQQQQQFVYSLTPLLRGISMNTLHVDMKFERLTHRTCTMAGDYDLLNVLVSG